MKIKDLNKVNNLYNFYEVKKNDYENLKKAIKDKECFTLKSESLYQTTSFKLTDNEVNIILKRLNSELEEIIKKLENLGVQPKLVYFAESYLNNAIKFINEGDYKKAKSEIKWALNKSNMQIYNEEKPKDSGVEIE